jgi:hypothetical protein
MRCILTRARVLVGLAGVVACTSACDDSKGAQNTAEPAVTLTAKSAPAEPPPDPNRNNYKKPSVEGTVSFEGLKDGDTIEGKNIMGMVAAELSFNVQGMTVAESGPVRSNTGHFVVITDGEPISEERAAVDGGKVRVFGKAEKRGTIPLSEGKHTLTLQFVDARDRSYGKTWATTINVTAKSAK